MARRTAFISRFSALALAGALALGMVSAASAETLPDDAVAPEVAATEVAPDVAPTEAVDSNTFVDDATGEVRTYSPDREFFVAEDLPATGLLELESLSATPSNAKPIYHLYSRKHEEHFFTISQTERDEILRRWPNAWAYVDEAFYAFTDKVAGTVPVYHLYNRVIEQHHFTSDAKERSDILAKYRDWTDAGISYYAYPASASVSGTSNLYRLWSPRHQNRTYTASKAQHDEILRKWPNAWVSEGVQFKVYTEAPKSSAAAIGQQVANLGVQYVGTPYYSPGATPSGWDCSGFVKWVVNRITGRSLPHGVQAQANQMTRISASEARPGDFWFRGTPGSFYHVAIYIGNNKVVHAADWGVGTIVQTIYGAGTFYRLSY